MDRAALDELERVKQEQVEWRKCSRDLPYTERTKADNEYQSQIKALRALVRESIGQDELEQAILGFLQERASKDVERLDTYGEVAHGVARNWDLDAELEKAIIPRVKRRIERLVALGKVLELRNDEAGRHRSYGYTGQTRVYCLPDYWEHLQRADSAEQLRKDELEKRAKEAQLRARRYEAATTLVDGGESLEIPLTDLEHLLDMLEAAG